MNGVYAFNHFNVVDTLGVSKPNRLGPQPRTNYKILVKGKVVSAFAPASISKKKTKIEEPNNLYTGSVISGGNKVVMDTTTNDGGWKVDDSILGNSNAGSGPNQDLLDSDGILTGNDGAISVTTGDVGQSNHSYDFAYCPLPKLDLVAQKATCDPITDQLKDNAKIILSNLQFSHKVGYSIGTTYTGPLFANASEINSSSYFEIDSLVGNSTATVYTVRIFNASDECSRDIQVTIDGTVCTVCKITANVEAPSIKVYNNGTPYDISDDYFTTLIQTNVISAGAAGLYEVVVNANADGTGGTVLNVGGTAYGSTIRVGLGKELKANSQPIKLTVRDMNKPACIESITVQADPFTIACKENICLPMIVIKN